MEEKNFEIVGLYPQFGMKNAFIQFSAHIFIPSVLGGLDIRGFNVRCNFKTNDIVYDPTQFEYDYEEKKIVRFPIVTSINTELWNDIKKALLALGKKEFKKINRKKVWPKYLPKSFTAYKKLKKGGLQKKETLKSPEGLAKAPEGTHTEKTLKN